MRTTLLLLFCLFLSPLAAQYDAIRYPVIPKPAQLLPFSGNFSLTEKTVILTDGKNHRKETEFFRRQVRQLFHIDIKYATKAASNYIYVSTDSSGVPHEGYQLFVNRNEINLYGGSAGVFYGMQTLLQLIQSTKDSIVYDADSNIVSVPGPRGYKFEYNIPSCSILDQPRFSWRGMHLDVSRHFFPKENIKEYLRWMAMYKLNTFHWHLTDDQGWRIEIKKYPKLTAIGAWRSGTLMGHYSETPDRYDNLRHGGYYTQADIREIVRYADSLHITIVPEIEMPGHASAMLAAYPELGCTPGPFEVQRTWGVFEDVLCPKEETFTFLENVLTEVCALFPGKYVHIGGDECPKERWKASSLCQELIRKHNLEDEHGLQSWFVQRIVKFLETKGKRAIGWDEILEGGLPDGAAVMSWRGEDGGIAAAKAKHFVVMSPGSHCYFDHFQSQSDGEPLAIGGYLPIEKVYSYDPVPNVLSADEKKFILGAQANVWTEYMSIWPQVQYMVFPRIGALAEAVWTEPGNKSFPFFVSRSLVHRKLLDRMQVLYSYTLLELSCSMQSDANGEGTWLTFHSPAHDPVLYTYSARGLYGKTLCSPITYTGPIHLTRDTIIDAWLVRIVDADTFNISPATRKQFEINTATGKPVSLSRPPHASYNAGGTAKLTDGQTGDHVGRWNGADWLGWWGDSAQATVDLGKEQEIRYVAMTFLCDTGSWIYFPKFYRIEISSDGKQFTHVTYWENTGYSHWSGTLRLTEKGYKLPAPQKARYVRFSAAPPAKIPAGSPGAGNPAWLFISEIKVE